MGRKYLLMIFMALTVPLMGRVNQSEDFQLWTSWGLRKKLSEKWSAHLLTEYRYGNDASEMYLMFTQLNISYALTKWINVIPGYRQRWLADPLNRGDYISFYEPIFALTPHFERNGWKLSDRNRIDYVIPKGRDHFWVYRNKLTLITPWKVTKAKMTPYFEDEFFWVEEFGIAQNRMWLGGIFTFSEHLTGQCYYLLRHIKLLRGWRHHNILGFRGIYSF